MIKFFRHIRQRMIKENRISKYLLYAIGEIILVVIGILIALQVNDWNENRARKELEVSTLKQLKANLQADIKDIQGDMRVYQAVAHSCELIIHLIDGTIPYHDSLTIHLGKIPVQGVFAPTNVVYENLKRTGIQLISNDTLRNAVSDLYEGRYKYLEEYMNTEYQFDRQTLGEYYLKEMQEYALLKYAKPVDANRLIADQEFRNLLMLRKMKIEGWFETQYEISMKSADRVIEMIDKEIAE
jgi:hypothetical protein